MIFVLWYPKAQNQKLSKVNLRFRFITGTDSVPSHSVGYRISPESKGISMTPAFWEAGEDEITKNL